MKKFTAALCTVLLLIGAVLVPGAAAAGPALANTRAYCIMDADTGLVLAQQNMDEELHPASITKVMTLGLACEKAQGDWDDVKLTVSHEDVYSLAGTDSSHIALLDALAGVPRCVAEAMKPTSATAKGSAIMRSMRTARSWSIANRRARAMMMKATTPAGAKAVNSARERLSRPLVISRFPCG